MNPITGKFRIATTRIGDGAGRPAGKSRAKKRLLWERRFIRSRILVDFLIDPGNFLAPAPPLPVFHIHYCFRRPVQVIGDKGYLLVDLLFRVAFQPSPN
ncbi:MAG: hypothetical protein H6628_09720 [Calditrichae bacterium]|nr:hypothetical protein [Calditrichota bacterium]MCB9088574.1 hypothetical protein [Calditrichia bacterium]